MKKKLITGLTVLVFGAATLPLLAQQDQQNQQDVQQPAGASRVVAQSKTLKGTIEDINKDTREVTIKGEGGKTVQITVPEEARNFDQLKKGDQVTAKYYQALAVGVRKSDEPP